MDKHHRYETTVRWTGNKGTGTSAYRAYGRDHEIRGPGKPAIPASSDTAFGGDASRYNPEELLVAALSTCHMLWYLHLCAVNKVVVLDYEDQAGGIMEETADGGGHFVQVTLRPSITVTAESDLETAKRLHHDAHGKCFIANSVNFPVGCEPVIRHAGQPGMRCRTPLGATPVWDPEGTRKISAKTHHQKIDFNIFEDLMVKGIPSYTISQGKVLWANGKLDAVKGAGRYIDRPPFPISYEAVAKMNQARTPRAVVRSAA